MPANVFLRLAWSIPNHTEISSIPVKSSSNFYTCNECLEWHSRILKSDIIHHPPVAVELQIWFESREWRFTLYFIPCFVCSAHFSKVHGAREQPVLIGAVFFLRRTRSVDSLDSFLAPLLPHHYLTPARRHQQEWPRKSSHYSGTSTGEVQPLSVVGVAIWWNFDLALKELYSI